MGLAPRMFRPPGKEYPVGAGRFQAASGRAEDLRGPPRRRPWFAAIMLPIMLGACVAACGEPPARPVAPVAPAAPAPPAATLCGQAGWPQTPVEGGAYV